MEEERPILSKIEKSARSFMRRDPKKPVPKGGFGRSKTVSEDISTKGNEFNTTDEKNTIDNDVYESSSKATTESSNINMEIKAVEIKCHINKDADYHERTLNVDEYADALYELFNSAEGEFCFGLFGNWGRGKSYLLKIAKNKFAENNYEVINFNAWKYRGTPEIWVHLYDAFYTRARELSFFSSFFLAIRSGFIKYEYWKLIIYLCFILLAIIPSVCKINAVWFTYNLVGIGGILLFYRIFNIRKYFVKLKNTYGNISSHREKLGLQAVIGDDLRSLIIGWIPQNFFKEKGGYVLPSISLCLIFIVSGYVVNKSELDNVIAWTYYVFLILTVLIIVFSLKKKHEDTKKFLLVVDDLDRCEPDQMLHIIESLKLMLEDNEIQKRVQIAMLIEEKMFRYAIYKKFYKIILMTTNNQIDYKISKEELYHQTVNEHIEKLLTCYIRLDKLNINEVRDIMSKSIGYKFKTDDKMNYDSKNRKSDDRIKDISERIIYDDKEKGILITYCDNMLNWNPRTIRIFLFKYQMCRILASKLSIKFDSDKVAKMLVNGDLFNTKNGIESNDSLSKIVNQVI